MFVDEMVKIHPLILREALKRQMKLFPTKEISLPYLAILDYLKEVDSAKMSDITKVLGITMGAVTGIIDKMTKKGFVIRERSDEDRRVVYVKMLRKGEELANKFGNIKRQVIGDLFSVLSEKEKEEYLVMMRKVYKYIKEKS